MMYSLFLLIIWILIHSFSTVFGKEVLYDMPVSNHGARVRMIIYSKGIETQIDINDPKVLGGAKSVKYMQLNRQGKTPLLVTKENFSIAESDTIAKYLLHKYINFGPSFSPPTLMQRVLCDQIIRFHDLYISPIQGSMYKVKGTTFSSFGVDRTAALKELQKQLSNIDQLLAAFKVTYPNLSCCDPYLCGKEISLADATLFPTFVFCDFILPTVFDWKKEDYQCKYFGHWFTEEVPAAKLVREEIVEALSEWKANGRFDLIENEMHHN